MGSKSPWQTVPGWVTEVSDLTCPPSISVQGAGSLCSVWCVLISLPFTASFPRRMVPFWCFCQAGITSALCMSSWCLKSCLSQVKPKLPVGLLAVPLGAGSFCMGLLQLCWIHFSLVSSPEYSAASVSVISFPLLTTTHFSQCGSDNLKNNLTCIFLLLSFPAAGRTPTKTKLHPWAASPALLIVPLNPVDLRLRLSSTLCLSDTL